MGYTILIFFRKIFYYCLNFPKNGRNIEILTRPSKHPHPSPEIPIIWNILASVSVTFLLGPAVSFKAFVHEKKLILAGDFASLGILNIYVKLRLALQIPVVPATLSTTVTEKKCKWHPILGKILHETYISSITKLCGIVCEHFIISRTFPLRFPCP